jgi:hypothetical protein
MQVVLAVLATYSAHKEPIPYHLITCCRYSVGKSTRAVEREKELILRHRESDGK